MENITEHQAICAFKAGNMYRELALKFGRTETLTLSRAMEIANRYANGEEEDRLRSSKSRAGDAQQSDNNKGKKHKRKADAGGIVEATALASQGKKNPPKAEEGLERKEASHHEERHPRPTLPDPYEER